MKRYFLNDFNGIVTVDEKAVKLKGSYIIQYHNSTVKVGKAVYKAEEIFAAEPEAFLFQIIGVQNEVDEVLSLQMIKELNINNTRKLGNWGNMPKWREHSATLYRLPYYC